MIPALEHWIKIEPGRWHSVEKGHFCSQLAVMGSTIARHWRMNGLGIVWRRATSQLNRQLWFTQQKSSIPRSFPVRENL